LKEEKSDEGFDEHAIRTSQKGAESSQAKIYLVRATHFTPYLDNTKSMHTPAELLPILIILLTDIENSIEFSI
jgi:hypothetical protein